MNDLERAVVERRTRIAELTSEVEALELALSITRGGAGPVKAPPPAARRAKPVRAEKSQSKRAKRAPCPHGEASRNKCLTCRREYQNAWYAAKRAKAGKAAAPKAKSADPVPVQEVIATASQPPAPHAEAAKKWAGQCPMLDSGTGKRCSLQAGHAMPHSASGRTFSAAAAINLTAMGGSVREVAS